MYPSEAADRFSVRMPEGMRPKIAALAKANHRSMNSEIVMILATALGDESKPATGGSFQAHPAAGPDSTAFQSGPAT